MRAFTDFLQRHLIFVWITLILSAYGAYDLLSKGYHFTTYHLGHPSLEIETFYSQGLQIYKNVGQVPLTVVDAKVTDERNFGATFEVRRDVEPGDTIEIRLSNSRTRAWIGAFRPDVWEPVVRYTEDRKDCFLWEWFSANTIFYERAMSLKPTPTNYGPVIVFPIDEYRPHLVNGEVTVKYRGLGGFMTASIPVYGVFNAYRSQECESLLQDAIMVAVGNVGASRN